MGCGADLGQPALDDSASTQQLRIGAASDGVYLPGCTPAPSRLSVLTSLLTVTTPGRIRDEVAARPAEPVTRLPAPATLRDAGDVALPTAESKRRGPAGGPIFAGMAAMGVPPCIPNSDQRREQGVDDLAASAAEQSGLPPDVAQGAAPRWRLDQGVCVPGMRS